MLSSLLFAAALVFSPADAKLAYETVRDLVENCTPRDAGTIRGQIAANHLLDAASAAGANVRRDSFTAQTPSGIKTFVNLYAEFPSGGADSKWVVLVSHYDTKPGTKCPGANDGASTAGLLVGIVNAVSSWTGRKGNLLLVWTDGEECVNAYGPNDGLWGARRAVEYLKAKDRRVQGVVCLDMLGDRDLGITVPKNGTPALARIAVHAARRAGYPDKVRVGDEIVTDDHVPFLEGGLSAIDLIDFSYGPDNSYWHTERDTMENISEESLLVSGRIVAELLNILL